MRRLKRLVVKERIGKDELKENERKREKEKLKENKKQTMENCSVPRGKTKDWPTC
jgi:hypothetical protein